MNATLEARPHPIDLDLTATAVVVVDMQNDFATKGGLFDSAGVDISGARKTIPEIQDVLAAARGADLPIVYLKMGYRPDLSDLGPSGR